MNTTLSRVMVPGLFFLFIFVSGFWLSRSGKPYPMLLFTVHKLIALGTVIYLGINFYRNFQSAGFQPVQIAAIAAAGVCFIATILAGGLASIDPPLPGVFAAIHKVSPYLTVLSTAAAVYFLL